MHNFGWPVDEHMKSSKPEKQAPPVNPRVAKDTKINREKSHSHTPPQDKFPTRATRGSSARLMTLRNNFGMLTNSILRLVVPTMHRKKKEASKRSATNINKCNPQIRQRNRGCDADKILIGFDTNMV